VSAIEREKQIKGGSREKKVGLIESMNSEWKDLYEMLWDSSDLTAVSRGEGRQTEKLTQSPNKQG
jgi:hypothetical protein